MADHATPNLPARSFDAAAAFYATLGFEPTWKDEGWMILQRGTVTLEFFPYPDLDPFQSSFSCCIRLDDLDEMVAAVSAAGVPLPLAASPACMLPAARIAAFGLPTSSIPTAPCSA